MIPVQIMIVTDISIYMSSEKGFIAFQKVSAFFHIHELFTKKFSDIINYSVISIANIGIMLISYLNAIKTMLMSNC